MSIAMLRRSQSMDPPMCGRTLGDAAHLALLLALALDIGAVRTLVGLNILEPSFLVADGIKLRSL